MILKEMKIIRTYILVSALLLFSGILSGQTVLDFILKAKALDRSGKPDQAIEILSSALNDRQDSHLLIERAEANFIKGDLSAALSDFNSANNLDKNSGEYGLARVYALKGDAATSLYHLEQNLRSTGKKSEKEILLDPAFTKIENRAEWRTFWKHEWYSAAEKSISEIEYYVSAGKVSDAEELLSELQKNYPGNDEIVYGKALINMISGRYADAVKTLAGLLAENPQNEKYLRALAKAQTGAANPAGASAAYSTLINLEIPDADLLILRAECYRKTGETEKALSDLQKYLSLYPGNRAALSMAGQTEASSGNNMKALEYFSENLKLHPNDENCYIDRANSYFLSRSWEWAVKDYSMSLDLNPGNSDAWLSKGIALLNSGRTDDACHDFRMSFSLGNKRATEYISRNCIK
jgi:tetratricopeptide (TPR) repeat protein